MTIFDKLMLQSVVIEETSPSLAVLARITIVLLAAWMAHFVLRRTNPSWGQRLWRSTAIVLICLPIMQIIGPVWNYQVSLTTFDSSFAVTNAWHPQSKFDVSQIPNLDPDPSERAHHTGPLDERPSSPARWSWIDLVVLIYLLGCGIGFLRIATGLLVHRRIIRDAEPAPEALPRQLADVARELKITRSVDLRISNSIAAPVLCGVLRPTILLPAAMRDKTRWRQMPAVFAHELAHVKSRDLSWNLGFAVLTTAGWFHPLVWFIRPVHAAICDSISDRVASKSVGSVSEYSRVLAQIALDSARCPSLSLSMARSSEVAGRIRRLKSLPLTNTSRPALIGGSLLWFTLMLGWVSIHAQVTEPEQPATIAEDEATTQTATDQQTHAKQSTRASLVNKEVDSAIDRGLQFLASRQGSAGEFVSAATPQYTIAYTAISGMAWLQSGSVPGQGKYGNHIDRAISFLLPSVQDSGFIGIKDNAGSMYAHAYALRFLAQAHIAKPTEQTKIAIEKAADLIVRSQNNSDGWRYTIESADADTCVTACQVIALLTARDAGVSVPQATIDRATAYLLKCQSDDGGFSYTSHSGGKSTLPRSSAVMSALLMADLESPKVVDGLTYLKSFAAPPSTKSNFFFYTEFHRSAAMGFTDDETFAAWYQPTRNVLLSTQRVDGSWQGIQHPAEYATAKACIVLLAPRSASDD